jgi:hypothetical protein
VRFLQEPATVGLREPMLGEHTNRYCSGDRRND